MLTAILIFLIAAIVVGCLLFGVLMAILPYLLGGLTILIGAALLFGEFGDVIKGFLKIVFKIALVITIAGLLLYLADGGALLLA